MGEERVARGAGNRGHYVALLPGYGVDEGGYSNVGTSDQCYKSCFKTIFYFHFLLCRCSELRPDSAHFAAADLEKADYANSIQYH